MSFYVFIEIYFYWNIFLLQYCVQKYYVRREPSAMFLIIFWLDFAFKKNLWHTSLNYKD